MKFFSLTFLTFLLLLLSCQKKNPSNQKEAISKSEIPAVTMCESERTKEATVSH